MTTGWVYAVHDDDGAVVYVGQTVYTTDARYLQHLRDARGDSATPFHQWLRMRIASGNVPRVSTIERPALENLSDRETFWIRHYATMPCSKLLNVAGRDDVSPPTGLRRQKPDPVRSRIMSAIGRMTDGPFYRFQLLGEADFAYHERNAPIEEVAHECLLAAGYIRREDSYFRAGSAADRISDPSVDIHVRLRQALRGRESRRGVQPGPMANRLCASTEETAAALRLIGYRRMRSGCWEPDPTSAALSDLGLSAGGAT